MVYDPTKDFLGLWRNVAGVVSKVEMPGLDYVVAALARAGLVTLSVSATAPVVNQATTAWLQTAVPSYSAEGVLYLWNPATSAYAIATPALLLVMLQAAAGQNGVSLRTTTGGAPLNTAGLDGDFAFRLDEPGGIYGPKTAGAWPSTPLPGSTDTLDSAKFDVTFGGAPGNTIYRGNSLWEGLAIGPDHTIMASSGIAPQWETVTGLLDAVFGVSQGALLYRAAEVWQALAPGAAGYLLTAAGVGASPAWSPRVPEFPPGTVMLFQQTAAPTGWTKQTALNDYGLRVTSGAVGSVAGSAFSAVFAQTAVGNTTITTATMPSHSHSVVRNPIQNPVSGGYSGTGNIGNPDVAGSTGSQGGDGAHSHSVNLTLAYVDVIIATKN